MNRLIEMMDNLENDCTLIDGDSGEEYLDIPVEKWKELRELVDSMTEPEAYKTSGLKFVKWR